jgi:hypothetical protein
LDEEKKRRVAAYAYHFGALWILEAIS